MSGLSEKDKANQVSALIYTTGDTADDILSTLGLSDVEKVKYRIRTNFQGM